MQEGKGYTFWSVLAASLIGAGDLLDEVADAAEVIDPTTYITSGDSYVDPVGNLVSFEQLMRTINNTSNSAPYMDGLGGSICTASGVGMNRCPGSK